MKGRVAGTAVLVLGVMAATPRQARAEWQFAGYLGGAHSQSNTLNIDQVSTNTNLSLTKVAYEDHPFGDRWYYGGRLGYFFSEHAGLEVEFNHLKVYARVDETALAEGTLRGAAISAEIPINSVVQSFGITHGVNLLLVNAVWRREILTPASGGPSRFTFSARLGAGGSVPHSESEVLGARTTGRYESGGFSLQAAGGLEYRIWHGVHGLGEYQVTRTLGRTWTLPEEPRKRLLTAITSWPEWRTTSSAGDLTPVLADRLDMNFRAPFMPIAMLCATMAAAPATAQSTDGQAPPGEVEAVDLFGFQMMQSERLKISGYFVAGWSFDGAQAELGFENQARVGQATITFSGRATDRIRYLISFNPVNEIPAKPACGQENFFFPNDPSLYVGGPVVPCDPETGHKRVDTYNTFALDYVYQQGPLREGYADWRISETMSARFGRFILPIGFAPLELGSWTAKDLTRIQLLNAEAQFGAMFAYARFREGPAAGARPTIPLWEVAAMGFLGDGNRQKDYDWFYFADTSLDTNSALTAAVSAQFRPDPRVDLRAAYKHGYTGSKVEELPSYWASKRHDDSLVVGAKVQVHPTTAVFGEYARYVWGPTKSSAEMLGVDDQPIGKPGYYFGGAFEVPVSTRARAGVTITREELSRDDSLVKYLAANALYGVALGQKDVGTVYRAYVDLARLVTFGAFWADISNPYPWISGSWPVSGDAAYTGRGPTRYGITLLLRTP